MKAPTKRMWARHALMPRFFVTLLGWWAANLEDLLTFMVDSGLAQESIPPDRYATNEFVEGGQ